ncbi:MAG: lactate utilization protein B [Pseudomonadota bacterium]
MTLQPTSKEFKANVSAALADPNLRQAMGQAGGGLAAKRAVAVAALPEFEALRDAARDVKNHTLTHLDLYLEKYEAQVEASGGQVHWAQTADEASKIVLDIVARAAEARGADDGKAIVNKGKSMISEEIGLNQALEAAGHTVVETDLGEYIIQLRGEHPSHIIAPAVHVTKAQVEEDFRAAHTQFAPDRRFPDAASLVREARAVLREKYFQADVGITGANMLIAETGQSVIVTNEGNGDLTQSLGCIHVVIASLEKIVPTLEDASTILRVLGRSATGQAMSVYTTFSRGPRRDEDPDGPEEYHVVLLDNGRTSMLGGEFQDMLRCIRCGACMNHCPVYQTVGGHAYGWVYPGPMGAVLTPNFIGVEEGGHLPNASTFCGRCESVCPMRIPLPKMMRHWREREFEQRLSPAPTRYGLDFWAFFAIRPTLYHWAARWAVWKMKLFARGEGSLGWLPFAGAWTKHRDFPTPEGRTFQQLWAQRQREREQDMRGVG